MTEVARLHRPDAPVRSVRRSLLGGIIAVLLLAACASESSDAPTLADPAETGRALAIDFLDMLQRADAEALEDFLAPAFQLQRPDGSGYDRDEYLADPAVVNTFEVGDDVIASQQGDLLIVRWGAQVNDLLTKCLYKHRKDWSKCQVEFA